MKFVKFEKLFGVGDVGELDDRLCEKNVCGNKVMCFFSKNRKFILKEMRESFNKGRDCMVLDNLKDLFGMDKIGMCRVKSDKRVYRIDCKEKFWKGNMKLIDEENIVYLVMKNFENVGTLVKNKDLLGDKKVKNQFLKIMIFRGIFRVSDGNMRNCLVGKDKKKLMSIDENNIGNRKNILGFKFNYKDYGDKDYEEVLEDLLKGGENKIKMIRENMLKYKFDEISIRIVVGNFNNLKEDVYKDIRDYGNKKVKVSMEKDNRKVGVFNSVSYNGYKCDLMKSCMQKYIRRNMFEKGVYCLWELDMFKGIVGGKGIRSNMRNRLLIILGEDVGYGDWKIWVKVSKWLDEWEKNRLDKDDIDRVYLINIYKILCESKKNRMCSFLRGAFYIGYKIEGVCSKYKEFYKNFNELEENKGKMFYKLGDSVELKRFLDGFVSMIEKGDDRVFYWFFEIINYKGELGRRGRRKKNEFVIMDIMEKLMKGNVVMYDIVLKWVCKNNNSRNECWIWIVGLIKFYMNRDLIDWNEDVGFELELGKEDVGKYIKKNWDGGKIEIDDFCIDMHVGEGRIKGKNGVDFWKEGGVVFNEEGIVDLYKNIYGDIKMKNY